MLNLSSRVKNKPSKSYLSPFEHSSDVERRIPGRVKNRLCKKTPHRELISRDSARPSPLVIGTFD